MRSILTSAAYQASPQLVKLLLDRGANPQGLPNESISPLSSAASAGNITVVALLQKYGADNVPPLCLAAAAGDIDQVRELLAAGVDANQQTARGETPLMYALRRGHPDVARLLLQSGANPNLFNQAGINAGFFMTLFASPNQTELQWRVSDEEAVRRLSALKEIFTEYPLDPNYQDKRGWTFLHQAAWAGGFVVSSDKRIDANLRDNEGRPPLLLVALSPQASDCEELITTYEKSKNPDDKGTKWNRSARLASILLQRGADPDLPMPNGETVRSLAIAAAEKAGNAQLVNVLKEAKKKEVPGP